MIINGAFIAEYARSADNMLDVLGGVWDSAILPRDARHLSARLVVLLQCGPDDVGRDFPVGFEVLDGGDEPLWTSDSQMVIPAQGFSGENRFWWFPVELTLRTEGRHVFVISIDKSTTSVPLRIHFG